MSVREFPDVTQGTDEWHDLRRGMVTASVIKALLTPTLKVADNDTSRAVTRQLVAERITGWTDPSFMNDDMFRGVMHEPIAREKYAETHGPVREIGFMIRGDNGYQVGYSPDGLVSENGLDVGLIEIKCPRAKEHVRTILEDAVPSQYMAQCQTALWVSGRDWIDYVSFVAGMPLWVKRVLPDPAWPDAIRAAVEAFETNAEAMTDAYLKAVEGLPTTERIEEEITF